MKISKLLLLFIAITMYGSKLSSQTITFPDTVLRQKLLTSTATNSIAFDAAGNSIAIDSNTDGMITLAEASAVHRLNLRHNYANRITSIEGLQEFDNLKSLDLYNNDISDPAQLYALSSTLEVLDISFNRSLENQNLQFSGTNLGNLVSLKASAIGLNTINVTGLTALQELDLSYNLLNNLNLTGCSNLTTLNAAFNNISGIASSGIVSLTYGTGDMNNVSNLDLSTNKLSVLPLADFPNLQVLYLNENNFTTLDVSALFNLVDFSCNENYITNINFGSINQLQYLSCSNNQLTNLNVSNFTLLNAIYCSNNNLTSLDITNNINLFLLYCPYNQLTTIDASNNSQLSGLNCSNNNLTSMYLKNDGPLMDGESSGFANNPNLNYICEDASQISYINSYIAQYGYTGVTVDSNCGIDPPCTDLVAIPDPNFEQALLDLNIDTDGQLNGTICRPDAEAAYQLWLLDRNISDLTGIEAFINIQWLYVGNNNLTSLNVTNNIALIHLQFASNNISSIDLSQNVNLQYLGCQNNLLTTLNLSNNINLKVIYCFNNQLIDLDLSNNPALERLYCWENNLKSLDLSANPNLISVNCERNNLEYLNVKNSTNIVNLQNVHSRYNPNLTCIMVDDVTYANTQATPNSFGVIAWTKDTIASYNTFCPSTPIAPGPIEPRFCNIFKSKFTMEWAAWPGAQGYEVEVISSLARGVQTYRLPADQTILSIRKLGEMSWRVRPVINQQGIWSEWTYKCNGLEVIDILPIKQQSATGDTLSDISIYPNPVGQGNTLYINSPETLQEVTIYSVNGRVVYTKKGDVQKVNTENLESGIYLIKILTGQNSVTKKVIIE